MKTSPPKRPLQFLRWFCREDYLEEIEGDLMEVFEKQHEDSPRKAKWKFAWSVIRYFRPEFMKSFRNSYQLSTASMFRHHLLIAYRNFFRHKSSFLINLAGLSIGMAACLLILQYVSFQLSFDRFNENMGDLYRVVNDRYQNGELIQHGTMTYSGVGKAMRDDFPEVVNHTRVEPLDAQILIQGNEKFGDQRGLAVDNAFLSMFSYPVVAGDRVTALEEPNSLVLSETLARKIFKIRDDNFEPVIGKELVMQWDSLPNKITAVFQDVPGNSHLSFDFLWSYVSLYSGPAPWRSADHNFTESSFWHYIQLVPGSDYRALEAKFPEFSQRYFQGNQISGSDEVFYLQPLSKAHLYSDFEYEIGNTDSATVIWGLLVIALLTIVIAWVNYINLTTAKSMERAKEVGVRIVSGADKGQLVKQFLTESLLVNGIALLVALLLVVLVQGDFNNLVKQELSLSLLFRQGLAGYDITVVLTVLMLGSMVLSGLYPAFVLSSFKPSLVLKGKRITSPKGAVLRKALVVGQFAITITLIIGSLVVYKQIGFIGSRNLGFNLSQIMAVKGPQLTDYDTVFFGRQHSFIAELKQLPGIEDAAYSRWLPGEEMSRSFDVYRSDRSSEQQHTFRRNTISRDFINVYQMKLLAGRNFAEADYHWDLSNLRTTILNETAVKLLGFVSAEEAIGEKINRGSSVWEIVGVVADFHQKSLRHPIEPTFFIPNSSTWNPFSIRVNPQHLPATLAAIQEKYGEFFPGNLFDYSFVDERFDTQYANDRLFGKVFAIFAGFAIFIACLGLLGLSLFATFQRTKEIGVRKVLGASVSNIVVLLSRDFMALVVLAFVIAAPVAWWIMHQWLQDFAYRMDMDWGLFIGAGVLAVLIALLTVSWQAVRAALMNPVDSLKSE